MKPWYAKTRYFKKLRKPHPCFRCGEIINKGEGAKYFFGGEWKQDKPIGLYFHIDKECYESTN